jgi:hypothetical protein
VYDTWRSTAVAEWKIRECHDSFYTVAMKNLFEKDICKDIENQLQDARKGIFIRNTFYEDHAH